MNLTPIFAEIKERLSVEKAIKLITWYNHQDETGTIHTQPVVFIEFPETLQCQQLRAQYQQAELTVRVHLISKIHTQKDGSIPDALISQHEHIAQLIYHRLHLHNIPPPETEKSGFTNTLARTACMFNLSPAGFVITVQDFQCMAYQTPIYPDDTTVIGNAQFIITT